MLLHCLRGFTIENSCELTAFSQLIQQLSLPALNTGEINELMILLGALCLLSDAFGNYLWTTLQVNFGVGTLQPIHFVSLCSS